MEEQYWWLKIVFSALNVKYAVFYCKNFAIIVK